MFALVKRHPFSCRGYTIDVQYSLRRTYTFQVGDRALVQPVKHTTSRLSKPLHPGRYVDVQNGKIPHEEIIGKTARDAIQIRGKSYRLLKPTLEDYIVGTPRIVTPIYPRDASLIVSHLDVHAGPPGSAHELETSLEILEAGTGHGGLTLYLAQAIHAANPPIPKAEGQQLTSVEHEPETNTGLDAADFTQGRDQGPAPFPASWRSQRRAVVHTLDISRENSLRARRIVRGFGRGIYAGNVDFHIGTIPEWIQEQQATRFRADEQERTFLSHFILDLPSCHEYLRDAANALRTDGKLLVFSPSVTQIAACVETIRKSFLPLRAVSVLELGIGITGGREWDVRSMKVRATARAEEQAARPLEAEAEASDIVARDDKSAETGYELVCRPSPYARAAGGGFLGIWEKMSPRNWSTNPLDEALISQ